MRTLRDFHCESCGATQERYMDSGVTCVHDLRQLGFKQGEVSIMRWIVNMEEMTNIAYRELTNEDT